MPDYRPDYRVDPEASKLIVRARSSIHDTTTTWSSISGTVDADPRTLEREGASARIAVDMTRFDAGDWLKNRKLRKDFHIDSNPVATFDLEELSDVVREGDKFTATAKGVISWQGRKVQVSVSGRGTVTDSELQATGTFELDIRDLGLEPPKLLMFKVESEVTVEVTLRARA